MNTLLVIFSLLVLALTALGTTVSTSAADAPSDEANAPWEPQENVATLPGKAGVELVNRGFWTQPDPHAPSLFHAAAAGMGSQPPPGNTHPQENQTRGQISISNATSPGDPQPPPFGIPATDAKGQRSAAPGTDRLFSQPKKALNRPAG